LRDDENESKKNLSMELALYKAKKQKALELHEEKLNMLDSNIKYLENKLKK